MPKGLRVYWGLVWNEGIYFIGILYVVVIRQVEFRVQGLETSSGRGSVSRGIFESACFRGYAMNVPPVVLCWGLCS